MGNTAAYGTVFKVDASGNETVLHTFGRKPDGQFPAAGLVQDLLAGYYLYGTTEYGGTNNQGMAFVIDPVTGEENALHYFSGGHGSNLIAGLVQDPVTDNLYGTTSAGGAHREGTVFELDLYGDEQVLHSFSGEKGDGAGPVGGLVLQENQTSGLNNLYGTTSGGGVYTWGTVFKLTPATKTALTSAPNPSVYGQAVTFTALVTPTPPDGETVSFIKAKTVLGAATLSGGLATWATSALKAGTTSVTAVYGGDSNFASSKSNVIKQVVAK